MNTHIIISIKDIEAIKNSRSTENMRNEDFKAECKDFYTLFTNAKQISLDEKDIEEKALKNYPDSDDIMKIYESADNDLKREGYKQALKDLL